MSPRQLGSLTGRFQSRQQREELLVGLLASVTANYSVSAPREPLSAVDFVFSGPKRSESAEMTDEQLDSVFAAVAVPAN
jgi:hypothetical protein